MRSTIIAAVLMLSLSLSVQVEARKGCCSHHGGVCGCQCCDGTALSPVCDNCSGSSSSYSNPASSENDQEEEIYYNTSSHKYHCPSCTWALRCTQSCITISLSEAIKSGGIACKVCGGHCK